MNDNQVFSARTAAILAHAVNNLSAEQKAERAAWCEANNIYGIRMHIDENDSMREFRWGGKTLALVEMDALTDDGPIEFDRIADLPDDPRDLQ